MSGILTAEPMDAKEARKRLTTAMPGVMLHGIEDLDPQVRGAMVRGCETMAAKFPGVKASDQHSPMPSAIYVMDEALARKAGLYGSPEPAGGAWAHGPNIVLNKTHHDETQDVESYASSVLLGPRFAELDYSSFSHTQSRMNQMEGVIAHEWGHTVDYKVFDRQGAWPVSVAGPIQEMPHASNYARKTDAENFAEGFLEWSAGLDTPSARSVGRTLAMAEIQTR